MHNKKDEHMSRIYGYLDLVERRPDLFPMRGKIVLDADKLLQFAVDNDKIVGLAYESPWHFLLVDVVADAEGNCAYAYERYVSLAESPGGVVMPVLDGKVVLNSNYRHTMGREVVELPRGYAEKGEDGYSAAVRELAEELGAKPVSSEVMGYVVADSGVAGGPVAVVAAEVERVDANIGHEGITGHVIMSLEELDDAIARGDVTDGFTLAAIAMWKARDN